MSISSGREELHIHQCYFAPIFLHNLMLLHSKVHDGNKDNNIINHLDIAQGLKDMLVSHGFELNSLLIIHPHELAEILGIDEYVAKLIISAAHNTNGKNVKDSYR
jgi:hypothetical protein